MVFAGLSDFIALKKRFAGIAFALCMLFAMQPAQASLIFDDSLLGTEILGGRFFVAETGEVRATFLGSDASYFNTLYQVFPDETVEPFFIFNRNGIFDEDGNPTFRSLGSYDAGDELIFSLYVENTDNTYYTGDGSNNPDGLAHARAVTRLLGGDYVTTVGFEDLYGGGDEDYNDFEFALTNVIDPPEEQALRAVPEPRLLLLLSCGLFILTLFSRRRKIS